MRLLVAALLAFAAVPAAAQTRADPPDGVMYFPTGDPELKASFEKAHAGFPDFFAHAAEPADDESGFMVKFDLLPEPDKAEYIWATVDSHAEGVTVARIANEPVDARFKRDQRVTIRDAQLLDWGYWKGDTLVGAESLHVQIARMPPEQAAKTRAAFGW